MTDMFDDIETATWSHVNDTASVQHQCTHDCKIVEVWTCKLHNSTKKNNYLSAFINEYHYYLNEKSVQLQHCSFYIEPAFYIEPSFYIEPAPSYGRMSIYITRGRCLYLWTFNILPDCLV